jgi:hypothetical protein
MLIGKPLPRGIKQLRLLVSVRVLQLSFVESESSLQGLIYHFCCAIAAYEAVKEYHNRKEKQGKKVSHSEMKAILAGMAMAEAIKLLESDDNDDDKDETVAEAGSAALKLFELLR